MPLQLHTFLVISAKYGKFVCYNNSGYLHSSTSMGGTSYSGFIYRDGKEENRMKNKGIIDIAHMWSL